jgi:hypothetical protein
MHPEGTSLSIAATGPGHDRDVVDWRFRRGGSTAWLRRHLRWLRRYRLVRVLLRNKYWRSQLFLRLARPDNLFQPYFDTCPDRYPEIFQFVREQLGDGPDLRLLSFGCATGEEVFSLRRYFRAAEVRGLDINRLHIAVCGWRRRAVGDRRMSFAVAGSLQHEATGSYDAVFCMAVLRHGDLSWSGTQRCDHRITFDAFERTVGDLARCVKDGGLLIIQHSNFRFCDAAPAAHFQSLLSVDNGHFNPQAPLFGPNNCRLDVASYGEVVFRKMVAPPFA